MKKIKFKFRKTSLLKNYWPLLTIPAWLLLAFLLLNPNLWLKLNPREPELPFAAQEAESSPEPTATPDSSPTPTATPVPTPKATASPQTNKLFKLNSISEWDSARPTLYPFGIYPYQKLSKVEFTFEGETSEVQLLSNGNYMKGYKLKVGENYITVHAVAENGQTQTETFTITNKDSLSNVSQDLVGRNCSEANLQECANYSKYSRPGLCKAYKTYILCLQSKCDVNTIERDSYCE